MKACKLSFLLLLMSIGLFAQDEEEPKTGGFKTENIFVGGGIGLGSSSVFGGSIGTGGSFFFSISPQVGYSFGKWLDVGLEFTYSSRSASDGYSNGYSASTIGIGPFVRIFPIPEFYLMAQPEFNSVKVSFNNSGTGSSTFSGNSFLAGAGYVTGGESSYFFTSILFDFGNSQYSPYKLENGTKLPIIRSGIVFHLGGGSKSRSSF